MSNEQETNAGPDQETAQPTCRRASECSWFSKSGRWAIALLLGTGVIVGAAYGVQAVAQSKAYEHFRLSASHEGGWQRGWGRGREHKPLAEMSDAEIEDRIERMIRHVGIEIDASPEQEEQIIARVVEVAKDLRPMKERMQLTGMELQHLLTSDTIDRAALETLRASRLAEADRISKTLVSAVADVAEVLTPEQREVLQELIREHRAKRRGHHRG